MKLWYGLHQNLINKIWSVEFHGMINTNLVDLVTYNGIRIYNEWCTLVCICIEFYVSIDKVLILWVLCKCGLLLLGE